MIEKTKIRWNASENEAIDPYATCFDGLSNSTLRLKPTEDFDTGETRFVEDDEFWKDFNPQIQLDVDFDELRKTTHLEADDITIALIIRDKILNKFLKVSSWESHDLPNHPIDLKEFWNDFSHSDRIEICLMAFPAETRDRGEGVARDKNDIVCRKTFALKTSNQSSKIPTRWALPEEFAELGVSEDTIYMVEWIGEDLEQPTKNVVRLMLNQIYEDKFDIMEQGGKVQKLFQNQMAANIFLELSLRALEDEEPPIEDTGMRRSMFNVLKEASGSEDDTDLLTKLHGRSDKTAVLHAWSQDYANLNVDFDKL